MLSSSDLELRKPIPFDKIKGEDVFEFKGVYRWCSNFWPAPVILDGETYPSVEHAYQAAKTLNPLLRSEFKACDHPGQAKKKAEFLPKKELRANWSQIKVDIMRDLVQQKFQNHEDLRKALLLTQEATLIEGNWHGDRFWGHVNGEGANMLGMLLMQTRRELVTSLGPSASKTVPRC